MRKIVALGAVLVTAAAAGAPAAADASTNAQGEKTLLRVVNQVRAQNGLPKLALDSKLRRAARSHSRDMAANGFFSHTSPTKGGFSQRASHFGLGGNVAENLAMTSEYCVNGGEAGQVVQMWLDSAAHRRNMLNRSLRRAGIGRVTHGGRALYTLILRG